MIHWTKKQLGLLSLLGFLFLACEGTQQIKTTDLPAVSQEKEPNKDNEGLFAAFVANLPKAKLPYEKPLDWQGEDMGQPLDSQSVVRYIDSLLFESECSCQYYQGIVLLEKAQYTAIAFPLDWNAGISIELRTYTKEGKQIDYFEFVKVFEISLNSYLTDEGLIRRLTIDHDLESSDQEISTKSQQVAYFQISPEGFIKPVDTPENAIESSNDCTFDQTTQTDAFVKAIPTIQSYTWDPVTHTATIPQPNGDTLELFRGGCDHYAVGGRIKTLQSVDLSNTQSWIGKALQLAEIMKSEMEVDSLRKAIQQKDFVIEAYDEHHYELGFTNEYLMMENYTFSAAKLDKTTIICASWYMN
ncbi:MAG: hypothetical protein R2828_23725 [Saprospiraceae bacterium]